MEQLSLFVKHNVRTRRKKRDEVLEELLLRQQKLERDIKLLKYLFVRRA